MLVQLTQGHVCRQACLPFYGKSGPHLMPALCSHLAQVNFLGGPIVEMPEVDVGHHPGHGHGGLWPQPEAMPVACHRRDQPRWGDGKDLLHTVHMMMKGSVSSCMLCLSMKRC